MKKKRICALILGVVLMIALLPITAQAGVTNPSYTITFDPGEGTGNMPSLTATEGIGFYMPVSTFTPPAGYSFVGWSIDVGATFNTFLPDSACEESGNPVYFTSNAIATAIWFPDGSSSISVLKFVAVYSSLANISSDNATILYATPADASPQHPGIGTSTYKATLTANTGYTLPPTITVELVEAYDADTTQDGNYYAPHRMIQTFSALTDYTYDANTGEIEITNATLQNINFDYNGIPVRYYIRITAAGVANPVPPSTYRVTYHANGGKGTMSPGSATAGVPFKLPHCAFTAPKGKQFKAWAIGSKNGKQIDANGTYTFTSPTTVYAIWGNRVLDDVPKTGDGSNIPLWVTVLFFSITGIVGTTLLYNKKKKQATE